MRGRTFDRGSNRNIRRRSNGGRGHGEGLRGVGPSPADEMKVLVDSSSARRRKRRRVQTAVVRAANAYLR